MSNDNANTNTSTDSNTGSSETSYMGRVKWFNNRAGYGFVTVLDNDKRGTDVFAHHSGISVDQEQYRYLVQGEYVSFQMSKSDSKNHKWQATNVRGVMEGKLMCETHWEMRKERDDRLRSTEMKPEFNNRHDSRRSRPRRYGGGPREDTEGFTLAKGGRHKTDNTVEEVE